VVVVILFGFDFLLRNFVGFALPRSPLRDLQGQAGALLDVIHELPLVNVEATVRDLAAILRTDDELLVQNLVVQVDDVLLRVCHVPKRKCTWQ
jgi:hypothetical protein